MSFFFKIKVYGYGNIMHIFDVDNYFLIVRAKQTGLFNLLSSFSQIFYIFILFVILSLICLLNPPSNQGGIYNQPQCKKINYFLICTQELPYGQKIANKAPINEANYLHKKIVLIQPENSTKTQQTTSTLNNIMLMFQIIFFFLISFFLLFFYTFILFQTR